MSSKALPVGITTQVTFIAYRQTIQLLYDGVWVQNYTVGAPRYYGPSFLYTSDPWNAPAAANVSDYSLVEFGADQLAYNLVKQSVPKNVTIPANYKLSFNITAFGFIGDYGSILHFSGNQKDYVEGTNSRMPAIWYAFL